MTTRDRSDRVRLGELTSLRSNIPPFRGPLSHKKRNEQIGGELPSPPLFVGLSSGDYNEISSGAYIKEFKKGEVLHFQGDAIRQVVLILSGLVKITALGSSGTEVILRLSRPGDILFEGNPFCSGSHATTAQVFRTGQALIWDSYTFRTYTDRFPVVHQNMARIMGTYLLELEDRFREMATERVGPRVARQVVRLVDQIGQTSNGVIEIGLSREDLAQMTGTTLYTVSRLFSIWEELGILIPRRQAVVIRNLPALQEIAAGN